MGAGKERVAEGVYRRGSKYVIRVWDAEKGNGRERTLPAGTTLAEAKREKAKADEVKRLGGGRAKETVASWAGEFVDGEWVRGRWLQVSPRSESTNIHNDQQVRAFAREFAGRSLESIREEEAQEFALAHRSTFKPLRAMFADAERFRLIDRNPFARVQIHVSRGRQDITVLSDEELEKLTQIARAVHGGYGPRFAAMITTAAWTGMRPGELYLLSSQPGEAVNYVDFRRGVVVVDWQLNAKTGKVSRPKYESQREVPLLPAAREALKGLAGGGLYFTTKRGLRLTQRTFFYYWDPVRKAFTAAMPESHWLPRRIAEHGDNGNLDFYELRHFFGTKLAHPPAGVPAASAFEIAHLMGHKDNGETARRVYIHTPADDVRKSIQDAWAKAS